MAGALSASHDITALRAEQAEMQRRNRDLDTIAKANLAVLSGADARPAICAAAWDATDALAVMLFEPDQAGQPSTARTTCGLDLPELSVPVDHSSLTGWTHCRADRHSLSCGCRYPPGAGHPPEADPAALSLLTSPLADRPAARVPQDEGLPA